MNKNPEKFAIEYLTRNGFKLEEDYNNFARQVIVIAVDALEKQLPKEIEIYDYGKAHCPVCKNDIHGIGKIKYCIYCGQRMNWNR